MKMIARLVGLVAVLFSLISGVQGVEERYLITGEAFVQDKWFGSVYERDGHDDSRLVVGGFGDRYYTLIKMPAHLYVPGTDRVILNRAVMNLQSVGSQNPTAMRKYFVRSTWSETSTTDHWGITLNPQAVIGAPPVNGNYSFDITGEFYAWLTGAEPNYGIALVPQEVNNNFNYFRSSENKLEWRPTVEVFYERLPRFKMPLPGGVAWKLTTEAGGKTYDNDTDPAHTGTQFYSLDFSSKYKPLGGGAEQSGVNVPILAAAAGKVYEVATQEHAQNGWYVRIDHDYDKSTGTGFQTVYLHMKPGLMVSVGDVVQLGQQIGVMGSTGNSTADHIHISFYFKGKAGTGPNGVDSSVELNYVKMENRALKDYDLSTTWNSTLGQFEPIYYQSTQFLTDW